MNIVIMLTNSSFQDYINLIIIVNLYSRVKGGGTGTRVEGKPIIELN